jgi:hypothetical protein
MIQINTPLDLGQKDAVRITAHETSYEAHARIRAAKPEPGEADAPGSVDDAQVVDVSDLDGLVLDPSPEPAYTDTIGGEKRTLVPPSVNRSRKRQNPRHKSVHATKRHASRIQNRNGPEDSG